MVSIDIGFGDNIYKGYCSIRGMKDKAFGYARKSPDDKEDIKTSIDNQIQLIKKVADELNVELVKIFIDENISGSDRLRKEFCKMRDELYISDVNIVIVKEQDRFARDNAFFEDTLTDFQAHGKKLYSCIRKKFVQVDDLGDMVTSMIDGNYVKSQRRKAEILFEQKVEKHLPISRPPFGYKMDKQSNFIINKKDAEIVKSVVLDYVSDIDCLVTLKKFRITKGKYYRIIRNSKEGIYSGWIIYKKRFKDSNKKIVRVEKIKYLGTYEPIISEELWRKVNLQN
jgi:DNA invertase Pin-like site-specific DNA recombinase